MSEDEYWKVAAELAAAIRLGYEAEQEDPNFHFDVPPDGEIQWLGAWLASEGFSRARARSRDQAPNGL